MAVRLWDEQHGSYYFCVSSCVTPSLWLCFMFSLYHSEEEKLLDPLVFAWSPKGSEVG